MAKKKMQSDYDRAMDLLTNKPCNILLHGKAGTGKTYILKKYMEYALENKINVVVCAPTGTAAVNIQGETAHSLFGIPVPCTGVSVSKVPPSKIKTLAMADVIIIDEISMMRNDVFSFAVKVIKKAEKEKGKKIRIILSGDFSQLPPVVTKSDAKNLKKYGYDTSGYPFTTKEWAGLKLKVVELKELHRQEDGSEFAENLSKVRDCDDSCIPYFWDFVNETYEPMDKDIILCGTNTEADEINRNYLESLPGNVVAYQSEKHGRGTSGIAEDIVLLKEDARVMFTVNDVVKGRYQNGTMGTVIKLDPKYVVVRTDAGEEIYVYPHEYRTYTYKIANGVLNKNQIGSVKQMPLKIAAAITIHKSQGKTFDHMVLNPVIFAAGQLYVALSRVRNPGGLVLTGEIKPEHLVPNPIVDEFYQNGFTYPVKKTTAVKKTTVKKTTKKTAKKKTTAKSAGKTSAKEVSGKKTTTKKTVAKKTTNKKTTVKSGKTKRSSKKSASAKKDCKAKTNKANITRKQ